MKEAIHAAAHAGDTLGGVFEVIAMGVPRRPGKRTCSGTESSMAGSPSRS